jgi:hypothetical protein
MLANIPLRPPDSTPLAKGLRDGHIFLKFDRIDRPARTVWVVGQSEDAKADSQGDIVDFEATLRAFKRWHGNIREMHQPIAAGRAIKVVADHKAKKVYVGIHVSEGAESTWQKILDGTLSGSSIGGHVVDAVTSKDVTGKKCRRITEYALDELSLVDVPANGKCVITAVTKRGELGQGVCGSIVKAASILHRPTLSDLLSI